MTPHQVGRKLFTGNPLGLDCTSANGANAGCAIKDSDTRSFGPGFNQAGGGVFAHTWDHSGIKIWHFPRSEIPDDITSGHPDPSKWPTPSASYPSQSCDIASHFYEHELVFDITVCGDWAGNVFPSQECPGTCKDAVTDHKNFVRG
jgi:hypothetical protein